MSSFAFLTALVSIYLLVFSNIYLSFAIGSTALAMGFIAFRRHHESARKRLIGATAMMLASLTVLVCLLKYGLLIAALSRLEDMLGI